MSCPKCQGGCASCGGGSWFSSAPGGSSDPNGAPRERRDFHVWSQSITLISDGTTQDHVVGTVPAAAAIDVFIRYRDPNTGTNEDPNGGNEVWKVWAVNRQVRSQVGPGKATKQAPTTGDDGVSRRIFAIRDQPAEAFDLSLNTTGVAAGTTVYFDVTIISWGREPTGIGPVELETFTSGDATPSTPIPVGGFAPLGMDQAAGTSVWRAWTFNFTSPYNPAGAGSSDGTTNANVLPVLYYTAAAPVLADGTLNPFRGDSSGNLLVNVASSSPAPAGSKFTSSAWEASHARAGAATLRAVLLSSRAAAAGFLFIFDAAALPANGTAPDFPPVPIPAGPSTASVDLPEGRAMATGIVVAFSSTQSTLTIGTADCWFEAHF